MSESSPVYNQVFLTASEELASELHVPTERYDVQPVKLDDDTIYYRHMDWNPEFEDKCIQYYVEFPAALQNVKGAHAARYHYQHDILPTVVNDNFLGAFFGGTTKKVTEIDLFFAANEGEFSLYNEDLVPYRTLLAMLASTQKMFDDRTWNSALSIVNTQQGIQFKHGTVPSLTHR